MKKFLSLFALLMSVFALVACTDTNESGKLEVVASTTMLGDLVSQIGQDKVNVTLLFGPGIDPHLALPTGGDTRVIRDADFVVFSGLHLEAQFGQILNAYSDKVVEVGEEINESYLLYVDEEGGQTVDPHIWFSVPIWIEVARVVGDELKAHDESNAEFYEANTLSYIEQLEALHQWIITETQKLTKAQRVLVTAHDAFNYFADTYDFEVAAIGGISTEGEITTDDINSVAGVIMEHGVKSIFIESTVPQTTVNAVIAEVNRRGGSVAIGNELFSDALGTGENAQYINAIKQNVNHIVNGLK